MTVTDIQTAEKNFLENPQTLTSQIVRKYLDPKGTATDEELAYFIAQAKVQNLNPFTKEIYFIKYGNQPAQVVTAKSAFEKKADSHPQFDGKEAGVIYLQDGEVKYSRGAFIPKGAEILGGWAKVYRKDRTYPTETEVSFEEYDNSKIRARVKELTQQGKDITYPVMSSYGKQIGENNWDTMPCVMIRKVALVSAYREAFPAELGSNYEADEIKFDNMPRDVTPHETQEEVRTRKMAQIEQMKQEQTRKQAEPVDTSYPADEPPDYLDEQTELLDENGELAY